MIGVGLVSAVISWEVINTVCFGLPIQATGRLEEVQLAVREPVVIRRRNGSQFSGQFGGLVEDGFIMKQQVGIDGSVEVEIGWQEVESVQFAGGEILEEVPDLFELGELQEVIDVLTPLYEQRSPFFRLLPDDMLKPFQLLASSYMRLGLATESLGVVRSLKPWLDADGERGVIEEIELLDYLMLHLNEEAVALARRKIETANDPSAASLGWIALSLHHLDLSQYREAWLCSVHPMLYDRRPDSPDMADAYLLAIVSTLRMNRPNLAQRYYQTFLERGLTLKRKPYQLRWVQFFETIDWLQLEEEAATIELYADVETSIATAEHIDQFNLPIPNIPLSKH